MRTPSDLGRALAREAGAHLDDGVATFGEQRTEPGMRVFRGRTVGELIPKIEAELGADALIVRRRDGLRGGFMGFFQQTYVEIEATRGTPGIDVYDDYDYAGPDGMDLDGELDLAAPPVAVPAQQPAPVAAPIPAPAPTPIPAPAPTPTAAPAPEHRVAPAPVAPGPVAPRPAPGLAARQPEPPATPVAPEMPPPSPRAPSFMPAYDPYGLRSGASAAGSHPERGRSVGGSGAYVTPELAELASGRVPTSTPPAPEPRRVPTARASVDFQELLGRAPSRPTGRSLAPGELLIAPSAPPAAAPAAGRPAAAPSHTHMRERRTVMAGSEGRAHAGVLRSLLRVGMSEEFACELLEAADAHTLPLAPGAGLAQAVRSTLVQRIPQALPLPCSGAAVAVVGAGGSGKTTCCAALLAAYRAGSSLDASYATIMRAAAGEPLQMVLSPELIAPVRAASQPALRAVHKVRSEGLAILDTPSLSPSDRRAVAELADVLMEMRLDRVVVAMSATVGAAAAEQMLAALAPLHPDAVAITHTDETDQIGVAVEAACRRGLAPELLLARGAGRGWGLQRCDPHELAARVLP